MNEVDDTDLELERSSQRESEMAHPVDSHQAHDEIERREKRFRHYFELGLIGMAITSPSKGMLEVNDELCRILGYERSELLQKSWAEITYPDDLPADVEQFNRVLAGEIDGYTLDKRWIRGDGHVISSIMSAKCVRRADGSVDYFVGLVQNITQRKHAEEELRKTQAELAHVTRLTTVGELTASIAHEVNQPLGAIVTNGHACLHLLSRDNPDIEEVRQAVEAIITDGIRAGEVIKRVRRLAKKSSGGKSTHSINNLVREVLALVAVELARNDINVQPQLALHLPLIVADRIQIQQVVLNLILNSKEAMSIVGWQPRDLMIRTEQTGPEILITVADTGIGIDWEDRKSAFEPFFTTKEGGLGLGLSISKTIIDAHGGRLWIKPSTNSHETTFQFTLPIA
jgi:PAS domain S-box-containing protein